MVPELASADSRYGSVPRPSRSVTARSAAARSEGRLTVGVGTGRGLHRASGVGNVVGRSLGRTPSRAVRCAWCAVASQPAADACGAGNCSAPAFCCNRAHSAASSLSRPIATCWPGMVGNGLGGGCGGGVVGPPTMRGSLTVQPVRARIPAPAAARKPRRSVEITRRRYRTERRPAGCDIGGYDAPHN